MRKRLSSEGFTLSELLIATVIVILTAAGTITLLGSTTQLSHRRSHRYEALEYAYQTMDTLKDYVTADTADPLHLYHLTNDDPGAGCAGGAANRYALSPLSGVQNHCHPLPSGVVKNQLAGKRTYTVEDVVLGGTTIKRVTVTVQWTEPQ